MTDYKHSTDTCRNVFKNGESAPSREAYTRKWIELINKLEKDKENNGMRT